LLWRLKKKVAKLPPVMKLADGNARKKRACAGAPTGSPDGCHEMLHFSTRIDGPSIAAAQSKREYRRL